MTFHERKAARAALRPQIQRIEPGPRTGAPPGLLQDDSRKLFRWFADRVDARWTLRQALTSNPSES